MKISKNFTLGEFTQNGKFKMSQRQRKNLDSLVINVLQPLRDYLKQPIIITSGFRPEKYNADTEGAAKTSQHMFKNQDSAADIFIKNVSNADILKTVNRLNLPVDQIIDEVDGAKRWVHISHLRDGIQRDQFLIARKEGDEMKYSYAPYI